MLFIGELTKINGLKIHGLYQLQKSFQVYLGKVFG